MSEVFYTLLVTSSFAFLLAVARMMYKSKCKDIKCCGCIEIQRDVEAEQEELQFQTVHGDNMESEMPRSSAPLPKVPRQLL